MVKKVMNAAPIALAMACIILAIICGSLAAGIAGHPKMTTEYRHYVEAQSAVSIARSATPPPPFIGRQYIYQSIWEIPFTHATIVLICMAFGAFLVGTLADSNSTTKPNISAAISKRFEPFGGIEIELPVREPIREPPDFAD